MLSATHIYQAQDQINQALNILLVTHQNPDGDAIGCLTAMMEYLDSLKKKYTAFCADEVPENLFYLKYSYHITHNIEEVINQKFDLVISLDCSTLDYTGLEQYLQRLKDQGVNILNIDHHQSDYYGTLNLVDESSSSTAALVYHLFKAWNVEISQEMATSLLTGILLDTNNFTNSATDIAALDMSAELIQLSGKYNYIIKQLYQNKDKNWLRFWSKVLSRLIKNDKLKIAYSVVLAEDYEEITPGSVDNVANFFNYLNEARITMVLKEVKDEQIKVSLRTTDDKIDVAKFAKVFGGGGHKKAAGFSIQGHLERAGNYWQII